MGEQIAKAGEYRERAAELRAVSAWMKDPDALKLMLATALEYERMALAVERRAPVNPSDGDDPPTTH